MILIFLLSLPLILCQIPPSTWQITPANTSNIWNNYGLSSLNGSCVWGFRDYLHNLVLKLYNDQTFGEYLQITIYFNYSLSRQYPTYNSTAHASYRMMKAQKVVQEIMQFDIMPHVDLFNNSLTIIEKNQEMLTVQMIKFVISPFLLPLSAVNLAIKAFLIAMMMRFYRLDGKLSISFVYCILGFQLQVSTAVINLFIEQEQDYIQVIGSMIGWFGVGIVLAALFYLPRPIMPWQQCQGLIMYFYLCSGGFLLSFNSNMLLFSLILLLQIRFNILKNHRIFMRIQALLIYIVDLIWIMYPLGCPVNAFRIKVNYPLCICIVPIAIIQIYLLREQSVRGPYLCLRQFINGKDYNYFDQIILAVAHNDVDQNNADNVEQVCSICLQSLEDEQFAENIRVRADGMKVAEIMKTPCNHKYHPVCLKKWLLDKDTCPMDNQKIPPFFE